MHRNTPIVVWIPHEKAYLVTDASALVRYQYTLPIDTVRKGKANIREYVAVRTLCDDALVCEMADSPDRA